MRHRESQEQAALISWAKVTRLRGVLVSDFLIATAAERKCSPQAGARRKAQGVKAGVSDLFLALPANGFCGLWIELKAPKTATSPAGRPSKEQLEWLDRMAQVGYAAHLCYGWTAARETIQDYLS